MSNTSYPHPKYPCRPERSGLVGGYGLYSPVELLLSYIEAGVNKWDTPKLHEWYESIDLTGLSSEHAERHIRIVLAGAIIDKLHCGTWPWESLG